MWSKHTAVQSQLMRILAIFTSFSFPLFISKLHTTLFQISLDACNPILQPIIDFRETKQHFHFHCLAPTPQSTGSFFCSPLTSMHPAICWWDDQDRPEKGQDTGLCGTAPEQPACTLHCSTSPAGGDRDRAHWVHFGIWTFCTPHNEWNVFFPISSFYLRWPDL